MGISLFFIVSTILVVILASGSELPPIDISEPVEPYRFSDDENWEANDDDYRDLDTIIDDDGDWTEQTFDPDTHYHMGL